MRREFGAPFDADAARTPRFFPSWCTPTRAA